MKIAETPKNILITGGAGFIGSNLIEPLIKDPRVGLVRVIDNLSNGFFRNIEEFANHPKFEFIEGDIRDYKLCLEACNGIDLVSHQAALGSVPRSINDPLTTNDVNVNGTLNVFHAVKETSVQRIVFAASSSTYGDSQNLPKVENIIGRPLSPYAVTKFVNEIYADVYAKTYCTFEYIGLRYFNIFGPKQDPDGAYAAVIPLFIKAALEGKSATINGDGRNSRDFTYIDNAIQANILALFSENTNAVNQIYNVACGEKTSLNELWEMICTTAGKNLEAHYGPERSGDISHSLANIDKISSLLGYKNKVDVGEGIKKTLEWYNKSSF